MKTNYANFYFRSLCIKLVLVDLRMTNLYQEAALSFKKFGDPALNHIGKVSPTFPAVIFSEDARFARKIERPQTGIK